MDLDPDEHDDDLLPQDRFSVANIPTWVWALVSAVGFAVIIALIFAITSGDETGEEVINDIPQTQVRAGEDPPASDPAGPAAKAQLTISRLDAATASGQTCTLSTAGAVLPVPEGWRANGDCTRFTPNDKDTAAGPITVSTTPANEGDQGQFDQDPDDGTFVQQARISFAGLSGTRTEIIPDAGYEEGVHIVRWHVVVGDTTVTLTAPGTESMPAAAAAADLMAETLAPTG